MVSQVLQPRQIHDRRDYFTKFSVMKSSLQLHCSLMSHHWAEQPKRSRCYGYSPTQSHHEQSGYRASSVQGASGCRAGWVSLVNWEKSRSILESEYLMCVSGWYSVFQGWKSRSGERWPFLGLQETSCPSAMSSSHRHGSVSTFTSMLSSK